MCTSKTGYLSGGPRLLDCAARIAALAELILIGRIDLADAAPSVDYAPTDRLVLDSLLAYLRVNPSATLRHVIEKSPVTMTDVIAEQEGRARGRWARWSERLDQHAVNVEKDTAAECIEIGQVPDPATAVVISLAEALGVVDVDPAGAFLDRCGDASGFIHDAARLLTSLAEHLALISTPIPN